MTIPLTLIVIVLSLSPVDSDARTGPARPINRSNLQCRPFLPRRLTQLRRIKRDHRSRIIAAVAAPAAVIRMLAPRRGVVPTSVAPQSLHRTALPPQPEMAHFGPGKKRPLAP